MYGQSPGVEKIYMKYMMCVMFANHVSLAIEWLSLLQIQAPIFGPALASPPIDDVSL